MARKQLNLSLSEEQYEWLLAVAGEAGEKPAATARRIVVGGGHPAAGDRPGRGNNSVADLVAGRVAIPARSSGKC